MSPRRPRHPLAVQAPPAPSRQAALTAGLIALLVTTSVATSRAGSFVPGASNDYTVGTGPRAIATADLNGDGRPDMIVGNEGASGVSVLLNQPGGGFAPAVLYNTGAVPGEVVIADFDGDGILDFAVGHYNTNTVVIMRGTGTGTFTTGVTLAGPPHPEGLCAADLDGDGMVDLAACGYATTSTGMASVWLNTGTPGGALSFGARSDYAVGAWPNSIRTGRLTPGSLGLVTANYNGASVTLLGNDGTGHFPARTDLAVPPHVYMAAVADMFPGEARSQIVTANADSNSITMLRWDDASSTWSRHDYPTTNRPSYVAIADADGDGLLDVVTSNYVSGQLSVFHGDPVHATLTSRVDVPTVTNPYAVAVGDFDGDGKPDLVASDRTGNTVRVTRGLAMVGWCAGDTIPTFSARNQNGDLVSVGPGGGKWLLLDLCSSWCTFCQAMAGHTEHTYATWLLGSSLRFEYVTMLVDGKTPSVPSTIDDARDWANIYRINRPVLHADGQPVGGTRAVAAASGMLYTPTLRLVDPNGVIRWVNAGAVDETTLVKVIARCAGVPVPAPAPSTTLTLETLHGATETVRFGSQTASAAYDSTFGVPGTIFFPQPTGTFGNGLYSEIGIRRDPLSGIELWEVSLGMSSPSPNQRVALPSDQAWRISLSDLSLALTKRGLPAGTKGRLYVDPGNANWSATTVHVPITWDGTTLTMGDLSPDSLAPYVPYYALDIVFDMLTPSLATDVAPAAPVAFAMHAPSPNPAARETKLAWTQPRAGEARLEVFDVTGRLVRTLANGTQPAGEHSLRWDLTDAGGSPVGVGLYFARVWVPGVGARTTRITVVR